MTKIIAAADLFLEEYAGGAELTLESILELSPHEVVKTKTSQISKDFIDQNQNNFWIFGNFASFSRDLLIYFIKKKINYTVFEYDYKFCSHRSPEKHLFEKNEECSCHDQRHGKEVALFLHKSSFLWWMSQQQKELYESKFPFLSEKKESYVLSSTFSERDTSFMKALTSLPNRNSNGQYLILNSDSWIKGKQDCIDFANKNNFPYRLVSGLQRQDFLRLMSESKGLIFLPPGKDTCPRLAIEARLLGCELRMNVNVQHAQEKWFLKNPIEIYEYLDNQKKYFWKTIEAMINAE